MDELPAYKKAGFRTSGYDLSIDILDQAKDEIEHIWQMLNS